MVEHHTALEVVHTVEAAAREGTDRMALVVEGLRAAVVGIGPVEVRHKAIAEAGESFVAVDMGYEIAVHMVAAVMKGSSGCMGSVGDTPLAARSLVERASLHSLVEGGILVAGIGSAEVAGNLL